MEKTFAGFWVDGAVRQPEKKHADGKDCVYVKIKKDDRFETFWLTGGSWDKVYWLDTTTPTELTPQQAFELLRVINPDVEMIEDCGGDWAATNPGSDIINWGDTTEYPPQKKWRVPTDADKGERCRYWDEGETPAYEDGTFWCIRFDGRFVVEADDEILAWDFCEVLDE